MTLRRAIHAAAAQLDLDEDLRRDASRDAEFLLLHTLGISRVALLAHPERELSSEQQSLYEENLRRRLQHEPIQYITGEQEFYGLLLKVTPAVLIPRPETEHLVESVLERMPGDGTFRIVDVGTGSGAIAIALAVHLRNAEITALDVSSEALAIAEANANVHRVADQIHFAESDLLAVVGSNAANEGEFDAIVSNPPYIPESDRTVLHPQVRNHEPAGALFGGVDGLDIYRRLIPQALIALKPNGLLALEIGHGQRDDLIELLAGWNDVVFVNDLQQIPRVALARKSSTVAKYC